MDPLLASTLFGVLLGLLVQVPSELLVAARFTRPKVAADIAAARAELEKHIDTKLAELKAALPAALDVDALVERLKPGVMRGGVDPVALNERKALLAEDRQAAVARAEVDMRVFLAERLGERGMEVARNVLGEETIAKALATGERWKHTLAPFLNKLPQRAAQSNGTEAARVEAPPME